MLYKNFLRELLYTTSRLISVIIITAVAVLLYVALSGLSYNSERIVNEYFENQNVADYWISGINLNRTDYYKIKNLESVSQIQPRIVINAEERDNENISLSLYGIADGYNINIPYIDQGRFPENNREMMMSKAFAEKQGLKIGDSYEMIINGTGKILKLQISAFINSPECMYHINSSTLSPDYSKYGFAYMDEDVLSDLWGKNVYNQFVVKVINGVSDKEFKNDINRILDGKATNVLALKDNKNAYMLLDQVAVVKIATIIFPFIFFLVAALIMFSTMSRIIENARGTIGTLKALGFDDRIIRIYYLAYAAIVVIIGYLAGALPANSLITQPISATLFSNVDLPPYIIGFDKMALVTAFVLTNIFCTGTALFITKKALRERPAECMRPKPPKTIKKNIFEKITLLWQKLNFTQKYIIRNIFRNKLRLAIFVFGITGCMTLILTSFGMNDSLNNYTTQLENELHKYDVVAMFQRNVSEKQYKHIKEMSINKNVQYEMTSGVRIFFEDKKETSTITVTDDILRLKLLDEASRRMPNNGVVMAQETADDLNIGIGDFVTVESMGSNKSYKMKVISLCGNIQGIYAGRTYWRSLGEEFVPTAAYIKTNNTEELAKRLLSYDFIASYDVKSEVINSITKQLTTISMIVFIFIGFGGILALVVLYNLGIMNFYEQTRNLATLMVLGFHHKEIKTLMLTENIVFTFVGILFGMPLGTMLTQALMGSMGTFNVEVLIRIRSYSISAAITIIFAVIVNNLLAKKMKTIDMLGALKSIE